jgi:HlyD family secretion protein
MFTRSMVACLPLLLGLAAGTACSSSASSSTRDQADTVRVTRGTFSRTLRLTGLVEAARSTTLTVPRLQGTGAFALVLTHLTPGGSLVKAGDILVRFDPQSQERVAFDRRAEYEDFAAQLARKEAEHRATQTADESELGKAQNAVQRSRLEMLKNEYLGAILVEKNEQTLAEAEASLAMLRRTFDVKRRAERADRRALAIQRDRAQAAMEHARKNIAAMTMRAPHDGLLVLKNVWKNGQFGEVQEGEEVRPGLPLLDVVDPARMRVRVRANQADAPFLKSGQTGDVELDAYPGKHFRGTVETITPAAATSVLSPRVRWFNATVAIEGTDPILLPDLTAAVDIVVERRENVLVVPRDSLAGEAKAPVVHVASGDAWTSTPVTVGALGDTDAVITSGLTEGAVLRRRPEARQR